MKKNGELILIAGGLFLGVLSTVSVVAAIGFFKLELKPGDNWWNDSGLSSWGQTFGTVFSIIIALILPVLMRHQESEKIKQRSWQISDITLRYNSNIIRTNEALIEIAEINLKKYVKYKSEISRQQVLPSIRGIVPIKFEDVVLISEHNYELSKSLAEFRSCFDTLIGVLDRNNERGLEGLEETIFYYINNLKKISNSIRERTTC